MSLLSKIFGDSATPVQQAPATTTTAPAQQQQMAQPGSIPVQPNVQGQVLADGTVSGAVPAQQVQVATQEPATPADPLDKFKDLWHTEPKTKGQLAAEQSNEPVQLTAESLQKVMANVDFSGAMSPDNLAAITAGGDDAQKALTSMLNAVAQQTMVQSTLVNNKLTEQAITAALAKQEATLPSLLRNQSMTEHLKNTNPLFSNPAVKPVMEATQQQLATKFPDATPAEIATMTQDFMLAMGETFAPKVTEPTNGVDDTDWTKYLVE